MELATYLKINPADSVVVCLQAKKKGEIIDIDGKSIALNQDTPAGHKVLIKDVKAGEDIIKYGYPIGHARRSQSAHQGCPPRRGHHQIRLPHRSCPARHEGGRLGE